MQSINVVNNNKKTHALLIPKNEWTRLKKILTKKDEDKAAIEMRKQLKDERHATSKAMSESWATTVLNKRKKGHEDRLKLLAFKEARQHEKDEIIKLKILKRRNAVVEKALLKKWLDRDSTKALNRAVHKVEVFKERSMQIEFNEAQKAKELEADCLLKIEQNLDAERYKTNRREQKIKQAETKKAYAAVLLNELKEREIIKSDNVVKLREEGKVELQRIANEIAEDIKNKKAKALATRENVLYHINESRKIKAENIKRRQLEDEKENVLISIMAEAKKKMARKRKLKEIEILKERQLLLEKLVKTITNNNQDKEEIAIQKAIEEKEQKYQEEELKKNVLMKKRIEDFENNKKILDEENRNEKERLTLSYQWELERNLRETEMLRSLETSRKQAKTREMNRFRENLNLQRDNNRAATRANKQVDIEEYNAQLKLWQQQDEEFMTYNKNMIDKYQKDGISVIPLIKAIEDYKKNKN